MSENSEIAVLKINLCETNRSIEKAEANLVLIRAEYDATIKRHSAFYGPIERLRIQLASENLKSRPQRSLIETLNQELEDLLKEQGVVKSEIDSLKRKKSRAYSEIQTQRTKLKKLDEKIRSKSGDLEPYKKPRKFNF
ncbi:MAG: hypothetical protein HXL12_03170 [Candidatus Nanosynbacter sp.]|nr:hypothetical protein [Candidatus Nanosynbacter sp.]